ncbi:MAG: hypothetical protein AAGE59_25530 [Cyanobacteria bacterium P01_F01_bin.86]
MEIKISEKTHFNFAKFFTPVLIVLFSLIPGHFKFWPFIKWNMYSEGDYKVPETVSHVELRVLDSQQNWHSLSRKDLYTIDDDSSSQPGSKKIIRRAFLEESQNAHIYHFYLKNHLEQELDIEIELIEVYELTWTLNYEKYPPFNIEKPDLIREVAKLNFSDDTN